MSHLSKWVYPPIGFAINIALGTIYSWSVFRVPLETLFGWNSFESSLPFTFFLAFFALTMPFGGRLMKTFSPRKTALMGAFLVGLGWMLASIVSYLPSPLIFMLLFYGIIAGVGVGLIYGVPISVSSRWIPERKGLATGITILGFGLSPFITAPTAAFLIETTGVLNSFFYIGLTYMFLLILLSLPLKFPAIETSSSSTSKLKLTSFELPSSQMVRTSAFIGLWLAYVFGTTGGFIAISLAAKYGTEVIKLSPALAAFATALFAVFNGIGRPIFGYICDKKSPRTSAILSFLIIAVAAVVATQAFVLGIYLISFAFLWFTFGGWLSIAPAATSSFFGFNNLGQNYGIVFTAYGIAAILGPMISSYIYSSTLSYESAFLVSALLAILGIIVSVMTFKPPKKV
jgi:MFS family permease